MTISDFLGLGRNDVYLLRFFELCVHLKYSITLSNLRLSRPLCDLLKSGRHQTR